VETTARRLPGCERMMTDSVARLRSTSARGLWLVVGVLVLAVVGLGSYYFLARGTAPSAPARTDVVSFSGDGDDVTESFSVTEPWQIHWETEGPAFTFAIAGDRDYGVVIEQDGPGSGVTSPVGSGTFHLEVTADGPWRVQVFQGE
jgi:hypothetical protein